MLATLAEFKTRYGIPSGDTADDTLIAELLARVSARIARRAGRTWQGVPCLEKTTFAAATPLILSVPEKRSRLELPAWPVISVTKVQEAADGDWAGAAELAEHTDYEVESAAGVLARYGNWLAGPQTVRIEYVGGYDTPAPAWVSGTQYAAGTDVSYGGVVYRCILLVPAPATTAPSADPTHWSVATTYTALPDDVVSTALDQAGVMYRLRNSLGVGNVGGAGGSAGLTAADGELLDGVISVCEGLRRRGT